MVGECAPEEPDVSFNLCGTCGGSGKIWETGCEATDYLNWKPCPRLLQPIAVVEAAERLVRSKR